MMNTFSRDH